MEFIKSVLPLSWHTSSGSFLGQSEQASAKPPAKENSMCKTSSSKDTWLCLQDILKARAETSSAKGFSFYSLGSTSAPPEQLSYKQLYEQATSYSAKLREKVDTEESKPVLIHLDDHRQAILWFWAVLFSGLVPVMSPAFSAFDEHRYKHLQGLSELLESPVCITTAASLQLFKGSKDTLKLHTVESLLNAEECHDPRRAQQHETKVASNALAVLMLTSGSTGNSKAVRLTHRQILAAVSGKASVRQLPDDGSFLNWIGMDHVASLVEIHLQALWLGVDQVHVHAADVVASPRFFLDLLSRHRVARSFAPNFFLAKMIAACEGDTGPNSWDLSKLIILASGGEANDVQTCVAASRLLALNGARPNVITTGFGMTETCAGAIFNLDCPNYDVEKGLTWASVGKCINGIEMRITSLSSGLPIRPNEVGNLELRGDLLFEGYYRNPGATAKSFTDDGWFRTGDMGFINKDGNLCLVGRAKETININGVKIVTADVQASLETVLRDTCTSRILCFPSRVSGAATEQITVCYITNKSLMKAKDLDEVDRLAFGACMSISSACKPCIFSIREQSFHLLPTTSLGKISGAKMRALFEAGVFDEEIACHRNTIAKFKKETGRTLPKTELTLAETLIQKDLAENQGLDDSDIIAAETSIFELGFTSLDVVRLKRRIELRLGITVPTITLMKHPTVRSLAAALEQLNPNFPSMQIANHQVEPAKEADRSYGTKDSYDPVVPLRLTGTKTPLWLFHPGVGEVLVFFGLATQMAVDDRPILALRARGFEPGQPVIASIVEAVDTYVKAIRNHQSRGPYALAGYSYGSMLAFEVAKVIESVHGEEVRFLASFNLPPHIKTRMRQLGWNMCLMHLAEFLGLVAEGYSDDQTAGDISRGEALEKLLEVADGSRLQELGLTPQGLVRWADVAYGLQSMAVDYEPSGLVSSIDVFHAEPLKVAAASREEWVSKQLSRWEDFSRTEPRLHEVEGKHYTMIDQVNVVGFAKKLQMALSARGI